MPNLVAFLLSLLFMTQVVPVQAQDRPLPLTCTYEVLIWNVDQKRSVEVSTIHHPYGELAPEEIDPMTGCTVCSEDQSLIHVPPFPVFSICSKIAPGVQAVFEELNLCTPAVYDKNFRKNRVTLFP